MTAAGAAPIFSTKQPTHIPVAIEMLTQLRTIKRTALLPQWSSVVVRRDAAIIRMPRVPFDFCSFARARTRECYKISKRDLIPEEIRAVVQREAEGKDKYILYVWIYRSPKVIRRGCEDTLMRADLKRTKGYERRSRNFVSRIREKGNKCRGKSMLKFDSCP